jgi:hypothetical protein
MMTMPVSPSDEHGSKAETAQKTTKTEKNQRILIYTIVSLVAITIGVGVAVSIFAPAFTSGNRERMIYSFAARIIFCTIGIAAQLLKDLPPVAAKPTDDKSTAAPPATHNAVGRPVLSFDVFEQLPIMSRNNMVFGHDVVAHWKNVGDKMAVNAEYATGIVVLAHDAAFSYPAWESRVPRAFSTCTQYAAMVLLAMRRCAWPRRTRWICVSG